MTRKETYELIAAFKRYDKALKHLNRLPPIPGLPEIADRLRVVDTAIADIKRLGGTI